MEAQENLRDNKFLKPIYEAIHDHNSAMIKLSLIANNIEHFSKESIAETILQAVELEKKT